MMSNLQMGIIFGIVFGLVDVAVMIPMKFGGNRKKKEAMLGAFIERFMLGFLIPNTSFGVNPAITGLFLGVGLSLPTAIITRVYAPIVGMGMIGGVIIGFATNALL